MLDKEVNEWTVLYDGYRTVSPSQFILVTCKYHSDYGILTVTCHLIVSYDQLPKLIKEKS